VTTKIHSTFYDIGGKISFEKLLFRYYDLLKIIISIITFC
jgi:hypothetical protein